jgi:hypothetical protein
MARNYIDVPILILKVRAKNTITAGYVLKGGDTGGWLNATAKGAACGVVAIESFDSSDASRYGGAMFYGTAYMGAADTTKAGRPAQWSAAGVMARVLDCVCYDIAVAIDPAAAATTRATRYLFMGAPTYDSVWA